MIDENVMTAMEIVALELGNAQSKYPEFPAGSSAGLDIITKQVVDLMRMVNTRKADIKQIEEAAHVAVAAIRFIHGKLEHKHKSYCAECVSFDITDGNGYCRDRKQSIPFGSKACPILFRKRK